MSHELIVVLVCIGLALVALLIGWAATLLPDNKPVLFEAYEEVEVEIDAR